MNKFEKLNQRILDITILDAKHKSKREFLLSLLEEIGELAKELKVEHNVFGSSHKNLDEGSTGESVDVYLCCVSMFFLGYIYDDEIPKKDKDRVEKRLALLELKNKWEDNYNGLPKHKEQVFNSIENLTEYAITGNWNSYLEAAQKAIDIFFFTNANKKLFYEIANKKLDKWGKSQTKSIELEGN